MDNRVDLHLHSTASDGVYTPTELVKVSIASGLEFISLTDHDTTNGVPKALDAAWGTPLTVIPGVEISTEADSQFEIHILGYYIDYQHPTLQARLQQLRESRAERAQKVLDLLAEKGYPVSWQRVAGLAGDGSIGRPHIAQAMVEANHVESVEMAFRRYLGRGMPAYVPRFKLSPHQAIELIQESGGIPVLAHPSRVVEHIPLLVREGLLGLEVYYNDYLQPEIEHLLGIAKKHDLVVTGGTDYHGPGITSASAPGATFVPTSVVEELRLRAQR
jgi:predicted metal-dependent phosphoesterase TrpH